MANKHLNILGLCLIFLTISVTIWAETAPTLKSYSIEGIVFLDGNVSTIQEEREPGIKDLILIISNQETGDSFQTVTDKNGRFLCQVPVGEYQITIDDSNSPIKNLKYFSVPPDPETFKDCIEINNGIKVMVGENVNLNIGLTQGWMTMPFEKEGLAKLQNPFDLDFRLNYYRFYNMKKSRKVIKENDNECGVDWSAPEDTPLLAIGPGTVISVRTGALRILHHIGNRAFVSLYGHIKKSNVAVGQKVARGQVVAFVGHTGSPSEWNHLHLGFWEVSPGLKFYQEIEDDIERRYIRIPVSPTERAVVEKGGTDVITILDSFRDVTDPDSESLWTIDNQPQYLNKITPMASLPRIKTVIGIAAKESSFIMKKYLKLLVMIIMKWNMGSEKMANSLKFTKQTV